MARQIPEKMLAAQVVESKKPYKIHEVPTPGKDLNEHDMLVKVAVGSLCHTDRMVSEGIMGTKLSCVASHEGAGTVVKVGTAIKEFKAGDRVLCSLTYHRCGECIDCKGPEQDRQYCANVGGYLGVTIDGSFAEYKVGDDRECCLLPDNLSFQSAAPLASGLKSGESVALGLSLAKGCGANLVIDARQGKEKIVEKVKNATDGKLADATLNVSDHESAAATSAAVTKMHGLLVQIAPPTNVSVPFAELIFRDIRIHGSLNSSREECQKMLEVASKNKINVKTNPFNGIKEIPKALELAHSGKMQGKLVIIIDNEAIQNEKKSRLEMV
ncbi:chaperonin 10-like protein [Rhexocercosporidium sp. MPI-PUGE-AT-0058]|nr:chaperonin 10-like protein [Rhexocercosporidium sp. MPI-PUGE-AT-0058]